MKCKHAADLFLETFGQMRDQKIEQLIRQYQLRRSKGLDFATSKIWF